MFIAKKDFEIEGLRKTKLLVLDFDGTMTDGFVYLDSNGNEMARCSRKDGLGIFMLKKAGIKVAVISTENSPIIFSRCHKLGIPCYHNSGLIEGKLKTLTELAKRERLSPDEIAYMGDDLNDLGAMKYASIKITVADGCPEIKEIADLVTEAEGGNHAVREVCDLILRVMEIDKKQLLKE